MSVGANIRKQRESVSMTLEELGRRVNVTQSMLSQIERGSKGVTVALALEIAEALGCELMDFIREEPNQDD